MSSTAERSDARRFTHEPTSAVALGYRRTVCATCGIDWPCPDSVKERCAARMAEGQDWCDCGNHAEQDGDQS